MIRGQCGSLGFLAIPDPYNALYVLGAAACCWVLLGAVAIAVADAFAFAVTVAFAIAVAVAFVLLCLLRLSQIAP